MGKRHRAARSHLKVIIGDAIKHHDSSLTVKQARKLLKDPGYKQDEFGELRSTIRKLTEHEILERLIWKASAEITAQVDAEILAELDEAIGAA